MDGGAKVVFENVDECVERLMLWGQRGRTAINHTVYDVGKRAPAWIANEIYLLYNIKQKEVKAHVHIAPKWDGHNYTLEFKGPTIAPTKSTFNLKPSKARKNDYLITYGAYAGNSKQIGDVKKKKKRNGPHSQKSGNILMLNDQTVVAQRISKRRNDIKVFKGPAVPSMVVSEHSSEAIMRKLAEGFEERLNHNVEQAFKR